MAEPTKENNLALAAIPLVYGDRQASYGHPYDNFSNTAKLWNAVLNIEVTPEQVALCMILVKVSRQLNSPNDDNITDGIGYFLTLERVIKRRKKIESFESRSELSATSSVAGK